MSKIIGTIREPIIGFDGLYVGDIVLLNRNSSYSLVQLLSPNYQNIEMIHTSELDSDVKHKWDATLFIETFEKIFVAKVDEGLTTLFWLRKKNPEYFI